MIERATRQRAYWTTGTPRIVRSASRLWDLALAEQRANVWEAAPDESLHPVPEDRRYLDAPRTRTTRLWAGHPVVVQVSGMRPEMVEVPATVTPGQPPLYNAPQVVVSRAHMDDNTTYQPQREDTIYFLPTRSQDNYAWRSFTEIHRFMSYPWFPDTEAGRAEATASEDIHLLAGPDWCIRHYPSTEHLLPVIATYQVETNRTRVYLPLTEADYWLTRLPKSDHRFLYLLWSQILDFAVKHHQAEGPSVLVNITPSTVTPARVTDHGYCERNESLVDSTFRFAHDFLVRSCRDRVEEATARIKSLKTELAEWEGDLARRQQRFAAVMANPNPMPYRAETLAALEQAVRERVIRTAYTVHHSPFRDNQPAFAAHFGPLLTLQDGRWYRMEDALLHFLPWDPASANHLTVRLSRVGSGNHPHPNAILQNGSMPCIGHDGSVRVRAEQELRDAWHQGLVPWLRWWRSWLLQDNTADGYRSWISRAAPITAEEARTLIQERRAEEVVPCE